MSNIALLYGDKAHVAPRMPSCERYEHLLTPPIIERPIKDDTYYIDIGYEYEVNSDEVLPISECIRIIAEVKRYSTRATMPMARHLAKLLVKHYSQQTIAWATEKALISVFGCFPPDIGFEAIERFNHERFTQMSAPELVRQHCTRLMKDRRNKRRIAALHLKRQRRIALK